MRTGWPSASVLNLLPPHLIQWYYSVYTCTMLIAYITATITLLWTFISLLYSNNSIFCCAHPAALYISEYKGTWQGLFAYIWQACHARIPHILSWLTFIYHVSYSNILFYTCTLFTTTLHTSCWLAPRINHITGYCPVYLISDGISRVCRLDLGYHCNSKTAPQLPW